ncbi:ABC-type branched-chain amino acid transport system, substrate-binding protein [Parafrankia irregularis]|uniref:ABC-type branched-chain amino acid transport system, substrate-binding protein n=1 Tax=Parafrankia irregularis TaxID=795642 RepID=A0A0S4QNI0_9ACTN|nr:MULTISPECIES: ABC transporter substrate-binding protein [Parafrankia]CUU56655.1 ABC-type branched-chain amino acid transport system, substrate-binding protein [Parafrankia irregularis]
MVNSRIAEPIRIGWLLDTRFPEVMELDTRSDLREPFELVFNDAYEQGVLDRPVQVIFKEVDGLPRGSVRAVIDAYGELCDEGCLAVFGPHVSENILPVKEAIEERFRVPSIGLYGSDEGLGEWTFALPNGSMTDEPIIWAELMRRGGHERVGVLVERSQTGAEHLAGFRRACRDEGLQIVAEESIAQVGRDVTDQVTRIRDAGATTLALCGFGMGLWGVNAALRKLGWDPPRYTGTALEDAYAVPDLWEPVVGWIGLEQYDEANKVGQKFLDRFEEVYGRRPEYFAPVVVRDAAVCFLDALVNARPLSPRGVKEALERVKMLPAASGSPGTRLSFGKWTRRGWMGAGYLVARRLDPDGKTSHFVARYGDE